MSYKSFEDYYRAATIKHLVLFEHDGYLVSPPFCTDTCKEYSKVMFIKDGKVSFLDVDTPPATSKYNSMVTIGDSMYFPPYGIWDNFNTLLEIKDNKPYYHTIDSSSKGQYYNMSSDGSTAFAAPLGYEPISSCLFIKDGVVKQIPVEESPILKRHMGSVYCNGKYYSPPRGEDNTYNQLLTFDPVTEQVKMIDVPGLPLSKRKYTDFLVIGTKLYALPFGREVELRDMLVVDTTDDSVELIELNTPHFMKKYNAGVVLDETIIAMPYGHKDDGDASTGLIFNTVTREQKTFDIGKGFGGKYRFRTGCEYNGNAVFFPAGAPNADINVINKNGDVVFRTSYPDFIIGRPLVHKGLVYTLAYNVYSKDHYILTMNSQFHIDFTAITLL
jgi:hypothetical protein